MVVNITKRRIGISRVDHLCIHFPRTLIRTLSPTLSFLHYPPFSFFNMASQDNKTFQYQHKLPHLPVPPLEDTARRYLRALEGLQDPKERAHTKQAVDEFLAGDGPRIQHKLENYAATKDRQVRCACDSARRRV